MKYKEILDKIIQIPFGNYVKHPTKKTQVVLHHTVSGGSAKAVAKFWATKKGPIGTCIVIDKKGIAHQLFSSRYWAGHVGGRKTMTPEFMKFNLPYRSTSRSSIGVELIAWGGLKEVDGKLYNYYGKEHKGKDPYFIEAGYKGYNYFDRYTKEQIETLKGLLLYWNYVYKIPLDYNEDMWNVNEAALSNVKGIYSHTSFRSDKSDLYPDEDLINMLKSLKHENLDKIY